MDERYTPEELAAFAASARAAAERFAPEALALILQYHKSPDDFISFAMRQPDPKMLSGCFELAARRGSIFQQVFLLSFGLPDGRRRTPDEIAAFTGISRARILQVRSDCLRLGRSFKKPSPNG